MRKDRKVWLEQLVPIFLTGGLCYFLSPEVGLIAGVAFSLFFGVATAMVLAHIYRREESHFEPEAISAMQTLLNKARSFYATSTMPFQDWLSPASIYYLLIQGERKEQRESFDFKRIFLLEKTSSKET